LSGYFTEAVSVILQYSPSVSSLLSRKKITKELIFKYLHKKKVPCIDPTTTKAAMLQTMTRYWAKVNKRQLDEDKVSKQEGAANRPAPSTAKQNNDDTEAKRHSPTNKPAPAPESPVRRVVVIQNDDPKPSKPATASKATQSDMQLAIIGVKF
jgi:Domain of unknown function (DUF4518)